MAKLIALIAFVVVVFILGTAPLAFAKNQEIHDFHFSTCTGSQCIELWSATGEMSQLQFAFSTQGATRIRLFDRKTKQEQNFEGVSSSYLPSLECITLAKADGGSLVISLETFKVESFAGKAQP